MAEQPRCSPCLPGGSCGLGAAGAEGRRGCCAAPDSRPAPRAPAGWCECAHPSSARCRGCRAVSMAAPPQRGSRPPVRTARRGAWPGAWPGGDPSPRRAADLCPPQPRLPARSPRTVPALGGAPAAGKGRAGSGSDPGLPRTPPPPPAALTSRRLCTACCCFWLFAGLLSILDQTKRKVFKNADCTAAGAMEEDRGGTHGNRGESKKERMYPEKSHL